MKVAAMLQASLKGDKERWSISGDIHEIKNLPVMLYSKQALMTLSKDGLLKKNVSGVKSTKHSCLVYGDTSFSFSEVMEAIFISGLFFYTPRDDASGLDELKASLSGLELKNQMRLRLAMKQIKNIPWS